jgi:uncharacterized OsmC-like protein
MDCYRLIIGVAETSQFTNLNIVFTAQYFKLKLMSSAQTIKTAFERNAKAISLRPSLAMGTGSSKCRLVQGLQCEIEEGPWKFKADMSTNAGGDASAPTPGMLGRAALGSCLTICYAMYAAKMDVPIQTLEVEVEADYDDSVLFGVFEDRVPGYRQVRYTVSVETDAPEAEILRVLDEADRHSPWLGVFSRPQHVIRQIQINALK